MDKRVEANRIVRECMTTALLQLMKEKNFEQISVSEITKRAGVSRTSYYRNYDSKEDILKQGLDQVMGAFLQQVSALPPDAGIWDAVQCAFEQAQKQHNFLMLIHRAGMDNLLRSHFDDFILTMAKRISILRDGPYPARMLSGALLSTLLYWYDTGMQQSYQSVADLFFTCMSGVLAVPETKQASVFQKI